MLGERLSLILGDSDSESDGLRLSEILGLKLGDNEGLKL